MSRDLYVSEAFGPTVQGEGPHAGRTATFLRLMGCNLHCTWCDTAYTWDHTRYDLRAETQRMTTEDATRVLAAHPAPLLVVSGGEPLLQAEALRPVLGWAQAQGMDVEVETNGTLRPPQRLNGLVDQWNVSPKLLHSGNGEKGMVPASLRLWSAQPNAIFKFVCQRPDDVATVHNLTTLYQIAPERVWLMPEGTRVETLDARLVWLGPLAVAEGFNVSPRLHVAIWGVARGH